MSIRPARFVLGLLLSTALSAFALAAGECCPAPSAAPEQLPVAVHRVAPTYPKELRELGVQGRAVVEVLVDQRGRVTEATVVKATHPLLGERALAAARQWTYQPARAGGEAVPARLQVPFDFVLPQLATR